MKKFVSKYNEAEYLVMKHLLRYGMVPLTFYKSQDSADSVITEKPIYNCYLTQTGLICGSYEEFAKIFKYEYMLLPFVSFCSTKEDKITVFFDRMMVIYGLSTVEAAMEEKPAGYRPDFSIVEMRENIERVTASVAEINKTYQMFCKKWMKNLHKQILFQTVRNSWSEDFPDEILNPLYYQAYKESQKKSDIYQNFRFYVDAAVNSRL